MGKKVKRFPSLQRHTGCLSFTEHSRDLSSSSSNSQLGKITVTFYPVHVFFKKNFLVSYLPFIALCS